MTDSRLTPLIEYAYQSGATGVVVMSASDIGVQDHLANRCREPRCENYGLSKSCPPHVAGPSSFRTLIREFKQALFFKIDVPSDILLSSNQREIFRLLHETAAGIEITARSMGFERARAFAGSSCKQIFCEEHLFCSAISENGECRNPDKARPSMSGFGINVSSLVKMAGWTMESNLEGTRMMGVYGLVLID